MNNKGFTLVELLAVLIILGIVVGITMISINTNLGNTKEKTEEVFVDTIKDSLDMYLDSSDKKISFSSNECANISKKHGNVNLYKANTNISFSDVFNSEYRSLTVSEFVNPNNENVECNSTDKIITIYRDSDYVYYYSVKREDIDCLTIDLDKYISTLPEGVTCS